MPAADYVPETNEEYLARKRRKLLGEERRDRVQAFTGGALPPRSEALRLLGPVLYAVRTSEGLIKFGFTADLNRRLRAYVGGSLLAFRAGSRNAETDLHRSLAPSVARGREWYNPTPAVMAVVNEWRAALRLPAA